MILCTFSLQAFTPPLPGGTIVSLSGLTWWIGTDPQCFYAAKIIASGPTLTEQGYRTQASEVIVSLPRSTEWFQTNQKFYDGPNCISTIVYVSVKRTSTSDWVSLGMATTEGSCTKWVEDNYMHDVLFDMSLFQVEEVPIE